MQMLENRRRQILKCWDQGNPYELNSKMTRSQMSGFQSTRSLVRAQIELEVLICYLRSPYAMVAVGQNRRVTKKSLCKNSTGLERRKPWQRCETEYFHMLGTLQQKQCFSDYGR